VLCFLALGPEHADPLDFWWGPMSPALALALGIIVVGGFVILSRLDLLTMAVSFWLVFVAATAVVAATGHAMTARWHLGPVEGLHFWTVLAFSPEILVFLFFMLTDPKTVPAGRRGRIVFAVSVALLAALLIALAPTEFWAKVAVLAALAIVCVARPLATIVPAMRPVSRNVAAIGAVGLAVYLGALVVAGVSTRPDAVVAQPAAQLADLPRVVVRASRGVDAKLDRPTAVRIATDLQKRRPTCCFRRMIFWLEAGPDQFPVIVVRLEATADQRRLTETAEVALSAGGYRVARIRSR
jgi:hypothetical protein